MPFLYFHMYRIDVLSFEILRFLFLQNVSPKLLYTHWFFSNIKSVCFSHKIQCVWPPSTPEARDDFDDDMLEPELMAISQPDKVEGEDQVRLFLCVCLCVYVCMSTSLAKVFFFLLAKIRLVRERNNYIYLLAKEGCVALDQRPFRSTSLYTKVTMESL